LALSAANRGLRCEFFSAGAEVGKVFARAEIRKAAREVMSSSATNAPRSPRRSLRGPSLSPRHLTRPVILLPHSERRFIPGAFLIHALRTIAIAVVRRERRDEEEKARHERPTCRISKLRFRGLSGTENHFHVVPVISVKWLRDMR